jgi:hypothetical protein
MTVLDTVASTLATKGVLKDFGFRVGRSGLWVGYSGRGSALAAFLVARLSGLRVALVVLSRCRCSPRCFGSSRAPEPSASDRRGLSRRRDRAPERGAESPARCLVEPAGAASTGAAAPPPHLPRVDRFSADLRARTRNAEPAPPPGPQGARPRKGTRGPS